MDKKTSKKGIEQRSPLHRALVAVRDLRSKLEAVERARTEPIAIIGMACRFPGGAHNPESFWRELRDGVHAIREIPPDRWDAGAYYDPDPNAPGKMYTRYGGFLEDIDKFDAQFFRISPREAAAMDPQQRILMEVSWDALEHAGQEIDRLAGCQAGVFVAISTNDYAQRIALAGTTYLDAYYATGNSLNASAGRLSYFFGFQGPCMAVDAACASSLVAVHLACQSLRARECTLALAGGVSAILNPDSFIALSKARAMAPDGRCKTFDAGADGYVRGEGCGVVVLKRLSDAIADGDPLLAVIRGSAVGQDGRSSGLTVPNGSAQQAMIRAALTNAGVEPAQVSYVEAHGTGTSLGDPIEVRALGAVMGQGRPVDKPLLLGSVKTNIGHLEAAAGIAGVMKVVLALRNQEIPPHLHLKQINPDISLEKIPAVVPTERVPWLSGNGPRIAGVSAFGLSGTVAHVVLEEAPESCAIPAAGAGSTDGAYLVPISAQSAEALETLARSYRDFLSADPAGLPALADIAYTASVRRTHLEHRLAVVGRSQADVAEHISAYLQGEARPGLSSGHREVQRRRKLVFVFPGQGGQWVGMARDLLAQEPVFRSALAQCEQALRPYVDWSLLEVLTTDSSPSPHERIDIIQPAIFAIQVALAALWRAWGISPHAVVGHSMGEVAAACVAGALSLDDAARVLSRRSQLLRRRSGQGAMAVVELSLEEARRELTGYTDLLAVAASNSPKATVLSGEPKALEALLETLLQRGVFCRPVKVDVASHSPQMDILREDLLQALDGLQPRPGAVPIYSTVTGRVSDGGGFDAGYWVRNLREPVLFAPAIDRLAADGHDIFLELSPHPTLSVAIQEGLTHRGSEGTVLSSLRREEPARSVLLGTLGALYTSGYPIDWGRLYPTRGRCVGLPSYPWQRERFWIESAENSGQRRGMLASRPRGGAGSAPFPGERLRAPAIKEILFESQFSSALLPLLDDHRIEGEIVVPGACHLSMALSAAAEVFPPGVSLLENVTFPQALILPKDEVRTVQLVLAPDGSFQILSVTAGNEKEDSSWTLHATGRLRVDQRDANSAGGERVSLESIQARCLDEKSGPVFYEEMRRAGYHLGPAFQWIERIWHRDGEALCRMRSPRTPEETEGYQLYPGLLDSCFQLIAIASQTDGVAHLAHSEAIYVPIGVTHLKLFGRPNGTLYCHVVPHSAEEPAKGEVRSDVRLLDEAGNVVADVGFRGKLVSREVFLRGLQPRAIDWFYELVWQPTPVMPCKEVLCPDATNQKGRWLIFADTQGIADQLRSLLEARGETCLIVNPGQSYRVTKPAHYEVNPAHPAEFLELLKDSFGSQQSPCRGVVHLWSLDAVPPESTTVASLTRAQRMGSHSVLHLVQALAQAGWRDAPRLWLVTAGVQAIATTAGSVSIAQAPLWGLARVIVHEHPELRCTRIDLSPVPTSQEIQFLVDEMLSDGPEDQVALRGGTRYVARLLPRSPEALGQVLDSYSGRESFTPAGDRAYRLEISEPGVLDNLILRVTPRQTPGPAEVEIQVCAAGLNFRDVLSAMGAYPDLPKEGIKLGGECSGRITAVGPGIEDIHIGDEVIAIAPHSFSRFVTVSRTFVVPKPARLTFEEAATIPIAFMTAHYALHHLGRLVRDERVLIHAASGGVGLAAVQAAQRAGAEIFATAGSLEKREFLQKLGIRHVMDSRSLAFADEVMARTDGQGVDVVLNCLTGDAMQKSVSILGTYGRFLEIGKRDIYENSPLGLWPFNKGLSYFAIDVVNMFHVRPARCASLLREVVRLVDEGTLRPLPLQTFPISESSTAFRTMAQAKHIGKIVLSMDTENVLTAPAVEPTATFRSDATYLITGGLGGLGLHVARWMVDQGVRSLALVGRSAPSDAANEIVNDLEHAGAHVRVFRADVSRADHVANLLSEIDQAMPPLRGIIHAAGILDDGILLQMTAERFQAVMAPKVDGAWNLHSLTRDKFLDFFVLFSSAAALIGSPGQGNYAAANAFLDALAHHRHAVGRPALSINWGPWSGVGLAARPGRAGRLALRGIASITPAQGVETLARLLRQRVAQIGVMPLNVRHCFQSYPGLAEAPLFSELAREHDRAHLSAKQESPTRRALLSAEPAQRLPLLESHLREQAAQVLGLSPSRIDPQRPLGSLGFDSLMTLELRNRLEASLGLKLSATLVWNHPTVSALAVHLARTLDISALSNDAPDATPSRDLATETELAAVIDGLSEEAAEAILAEKLGILEEGMSR
ncbi:MAG: type I polyketide synthase [Acidobacteria bacterium]|nr:type I polyketide synthase [Acidobacteriota bacterium]